MSIKREPGSVTAPAAQRPRTAVAGTQPANRAPEQSGAPATLADHPGERDAVVVVDLPQGAATPDISAARPAAAGQREVHIAANLRELITARPLATPQAASLAKERRDLNEVVHSILIVGLVISTALMLVGVGLALLTQRDLPTAVPDVGDVFSRVLALRPSGFLALGLLILIATPILRVAGSIGAFLYERDWRYAAITSLVLGVLVVSLFLGRG